MTTPNFNLVYPPVGNTNNNLQYIKFVLPLGVATTIQIFTTAPAQGRFFTTKVIMSDFVGGGAVGSAVVSFGSISNTSNASTGIMPAVGLNLVGATGSVANQYLQFDPSFVGLNATATTTAYTSGIGVVNGLTPAVALASGDVMTAYVSTAANTTNATCNVHIIGFYL